MISCQQILQLLMSQLVTLCTNNHILIIIILEYLTLPSTYTHTHSQGEYKIISAHQGQDIIIIAKSMIM